VFIWRIVNVPDQPGMKGLIFDPVVSGRTYSPQVKTDLTDSVWVPLTSYAVPPVTNGTQVTITDTNAILPAEYYRLNISLP